MNKAAVLPAKFAQLVVKQTEIPVPKGAEILVKIHSAAVNPVDYKTQVAGRFFEDFPRVLGSDVAGTVESTGPDQKKFKKGDKVFSFVPIFQAPVGTAYGAFQQYTLTSDAGTGLVPDSTSFDSAATIPLALSTVADGYYNFLGLDKPSKTPVKKDEWLLVWGGAASVGQYAIQLGVASGYRVIATASKTWHSKLQELGASYVVDYHDADVIDQIQKFTHASVKLAFDAVAEEKTVKQTLEVLKNGGKIAYTQLTPETAKVECPETIKWARVFAGNLLSEKGSSLGHLIFDWASEALKDGRLVGMPVKLREGGVEAAQATLDYYRANGIQNGKYVINP